MFNILFCVVKQQNMLHWAIFSSGSIVGKLVGYRRCVASPVPCFALMTPKIKWLLFAEIQSSAVWDYTACIPAVYDTLCSFWPNFFYLCFCDLP